MSNGEKVLQKTFDGLKKQFIVPNLTSAKIEEDSVKVHFDDGNDGKYAFPWLRDNCRCDQCYDFICLARKYEVEHLDLDVRPNKAWIEDGLLNVLWDSSDEHHSVFGKEWLFIRGLTSHGKQIFENFYHPSKEIWGKDIELNTFEYEDVMINDKILLDYLLTLESKGITLLKNAPAEEGVGQKLINRIGHIRQTHFGKSRSVKVKQHHSYVSYTTDKLGLHTDLVYLVDCPGILMVHAVKQHEGKGGDSIICDGFYCAELIKKNHPEAFKMLSSTELYFWDKFHPDFHPNDNRFKMNKAPIFRVNTDGDVEQVQFNNQKRDTNIELKDGDVDDYYKALKIFLETIYANTFTYKLKTGDIMAMDNMRCMHGRKSFEYPSDRHLDVTFLDWDEASSRRRCLQEEVFGQQIYY